MTRLSLLMGVFMATTVTSVVLLLGVIEHITAYNMIFRGIIVFFIFGLLGTFLGSFLEVVLIPVTTKNELEKLKDKLKFEEAQIKAELGDLLSDDDVNKTNVETFGTPTDELQSVVSARSVNGSESESTAAVVS